MFILRLLNKLLFSLLIIISVFTPKVYAQEESLKVLLEIINLEGDNSINHNTDFPVKVPINAAGNVEISGSGPKIVEPWIVISVPKTAIIEKPAFIDSQIAYESIKHEDSNNWYITYKFNELSSGQIMTYPFPFSFREQPTLNGDEVTVKIEMIDGKDPNKAVLYSTSKTYRAVKTDYEITKSHLYTYGNDIRNGVYYYSVNVDEGATTIGETGKEVALRFTSHYDLPANVESGASFIRPDNWKVVVHLPPDVKPIGGQWTYDETTNTATLFLEKPNIGSSVFKKDISYLTKFLFKNKNLNEVHDINVEYYINVNTPKEKRLDDQSTKIAFEPNFFKSTYHLKFLKDNLSGRSESYPIKYWLNEGAYTIVGDKIYDKFIDQTENGLFYQINIINANNGSSLTNNEGGIVSEIFKITDNLSTQANDKRTYYKSFEIFEIKKYDDKFTNERYNEIIQEGIDTINNNPNKLYGIGADGSKTLIKENVKYKEKIILNDTEQKFVKLELEFSKGVRLNNTHMIINVQTFPSASEIEKFKNNPNISRQIYTGGAELVSESGKVITNQEDNRKVTIDGGRFAYTSLAPISPKAEIVTSGNQTIVYKANGTYLNYTTDGRFGSIYGEWGPLANEEIGEVKLIQLLPQGFNYVKNIYRSLYNGNIAEPEVIKNFKNTGRTAVIYTYPKIKAGDSLFDDFSVGTQIEATQYVERGNNLIESFIVYPKNDIILPYSNSKRYVDELDLDNDGDRNEIFIRASSQINYIPPLELLAKKQVGYDKNSKGLIATGDLGYEFNYVLSIFNNTIRAVEKVYLIDVLPHENDTTIVSNKEGLYLPRNSAFFTPLTMAIEDIPENAALLERFEFYYQTSEQGATFETVRDGEWLTKEQIDDFSKVKSFKIVLKNGKQIISKEQVDFIIKAKIPYDTKLDPNKFAINSSAVSTNGISYAEGNSISVAFTKYKVSGVVFKDFDNNGLKRNDEEGIENQKVELIDVATGEIAKDYNNNPIPAVFTDKDGKYEFTVYRRGEYRVRFTKDGNAEYSAVGFKNNVNGNNIESKVNDEALSYKFVLDPIRNSAIANAGIIATKRDVKVLKVSSLDQSVLPGAIFELKGTSYTKEETSNINGEIIFKDVPFGEYQLTEKTAPEGYAIKTASQNISVQASELQVIKVENDPILRNISLIKVDGDNPQLKLANVKFGLYKENSINPSYEAISNINGEVLFENVIKGKYYLREIETLTGYEKNTALNKEVIIESNGETIDLGQIKNTKIKGVVEVVKKDADTGAPLSQVVFALKQGNQEIKTAITDNRGIAVFNDVVYGEYTLVEKTAKQGYINSLREEIVKIETANQKVSINDWVNTAIKGKVIVHKKDADTGVPLSQVVFALKLGNQEIKTAITDDQGIATFNDVVYGEYTLVEKATLENYVISNREEMVNITQNGQEVVINNWTNSLKKGSVEFIKVNEKGEPVSKVEFELRHNGVVLDKVTSLADGKVKFDNIAYGEYTIHEVKAPDMYNLSNDIITFKITADGQKLILADVVNTYKKGVVKLIKTDAKDNTKKLAGVSFVLKQNDEVKYKAVSNDKGEVVFNDVIYGDYKLEESDTLINYNLSTEIKDVSIKNDKEEIDLGNYVNQIKKGKVSFIKVDKDDPNKVLAGVSFALMQNGEVKYSATSEANGIVSFNDVVYGQYKLVETSALENYNKLVEEYPVNIDRDNVHIDLGKITNEVKKGIISLRKVDKDNPAKGLAGVKFVLKQGTETKYEAISDLNGEVVFTGVVYGEYTLKEETPLINYNVSTKMETVQVSEHGKEIKLGPWENEIIKGTVEVTKVDKDDNNIKLANVKFGLKQGNEILYQAISGPDGKAKFENVVYGEYKLVELEAARGYVLNKVEEDINIDVHGELIEKTVSNQKIKGTVTLVKVDGSNPSKKLAKVVFELKQNDKVIQTAISDENGMVVFNDVEFGEYTIEEKTSITGYHRSDMILKVKVEEHLQEISLGEFKNMPINKPVQQTKVSDPDPVQKYVVPRTSVSTSGIIYAIIFITSIVLLILLNKKSYEA